MIIQKKLIDHHMIILELLCTAILEVKRDHIHIHADAGERFEHPVRIERLPAKGAGNLLSQCAVPEHHWPWRVLRSHGMFHINPTNLRGAIHIVFQGSLQMTMAMLTYDEMREVVPAQSALTSAEVLRMLPAAFRGPLWSSVLWVRTGLAALVVKVAGLLSDAIDDFHAIALSELPLRCLEGLHADDTRSTQCQVLTP